jgi:tRNA A37 threonylcarbamoyladenosine modification protein TsaB
VPTLEALAEAYAPPGLARVCAVLDARRGRWYAALVDRDGGGWRTAHGPFDLAAEGVERFAGGAPRVGLPQREPGPTSPEGSPERIAAPIAAAVARLVARDLDRYTVGAPGELRLVYTRPATDA